MINLVPQIRHIKTSETMENLLIEINRQENLGDEVYHQALAELFEIEKDPITLIKWKELYEMMESAIDDCEHAANVMRGVVLKNA